MGGRSGCHLGLCGAGKGEMGERPEHSPHPGLAQQSGTPFSNPGPAGYKGAAALPHDSFCTLLLLPPILADEPVLELKRLHIYPEHPFRPRRASPIASRSRACMAGSPDPGSR